MRTVALIFLTPSLVTIPGLPVDKPVRWTAKLFALACIVYPDVYQGIDFLVSTAESNLKYDFTVKSANPSQIKVEYAGDDKFKSALINLSDKNSQNA